MDPRFFLNVISGYIARRINRYGCFCHRSVSLAIHWIESFFYFAKKLLICSFLWNYTHENESVKMTDSHDIPYYR